MSTKSTWNVMGEYLQSVIETDTHPLQMELDKQHHLQNLEGDPGHFGFPVPDPDTPITDSFPFLMGMLDGVIEDTIILPFITTPSGHSSHVHLFPTLNGVGILILDATQEHDRLQEQQQVSNELFLLKQRQEKLLKQLEEANSAKSRFIASMSHEFRTPLTSVVGYTNLLREEGKQTIDGENYLQAIERNAQYLLIMIDNLLDQGKNDAGNLSINSTDTDLDTLLQEVDALISPLALQKGLIYSRIMSPKVPECLLLDPMRLKQMLINMTGNAVKYTDQGEVTVIVDWEESFLLVNIIDTGPGIPEEEQRRIFEPFHQPPSQTNKKGAGLGLAISKELSMAMKGDLRLIRSSSEGSEFQFWIEARTSTEQQQHPAPATEKTARVMIVEDDPDIQALLSFYLEAEGYLISTCNNGEMAIEQAINLQPELLIMDLNMPRLSGYEAIKILRERGFRNPAIAMTAATFDGVRAHIMSAGFDEYLQKPIDASLLNASVQALLSLH